MAVSEPLTLDAAKEFAPESVEFSLFVLYIRPVLTCFSEVEHIKAPLCIAIEYGIGREEYFLIV